MPRNPETGAPIMNRATRVHKPRAAFTIVEVLLVLALLVIIGAVGVVGLSGVLNQQQLHHAGDEIRIAWMQARIEAMKTGRIHVFRYMPGERQYVIQPWVGENDAVEGSPAGDAAEIDAAEITAATAGATATAGSSGGADEDAAPMMPGGQRLPGGVTFVDGQTVETNRSMFAEEDAASTGGVDGGGWSIPVMFYPDGQTSDAYVVMRNEAERYVKVTLRGLTGASRVSEIMTIEEISQ